ncbi:hypothetical protein [Paenibacillus alba]|uniref:Uncharacterized protein n=1 Tax=Paenibacillus alba TaxID=1197127 RepID=A0ABU6GBS4_9BACL|nr:hypothetical protein [Paenibacillus alba]MEC0231635.1 hypothetical protein [Paenibacillus alba]
MIFEWWERSAHWSVIETDFEDGSMVVLFSTGDCLFGRLGLLLAGFGLVRTSRLPFSQAQQRVGAFYALSLPFRQARLALGGFWLGSELETAFFAGSAAGWCFLCSEPAFSAGSACSWRVLAWFGA